MKFKNISGGPLTLPTLGIACVDDGGEFEVTNEPAKWLAEHSPYVKRVDGPGGTKPPAGDESEPPAGGSEDGDK